jgi:hypothetical protein
LSTSVTIPSGCQSFRSFAGCFCASMYYQCLMDSLYTMIPTTNVSISMLSKASLTFMVAALLLFHLAVHFYLRFLLIVTNDKPTSQQNRRLCDAMVLVARTRVLVHSPRIPIPGQPFNSPQRPDPTRLHDKGRLIQWLPNPPDRKRPQNMPMPHHQHIPVHPLRLGLPNNRPMLFVPNFLDQSIHSLNNIFRRLAAWTAICPDIPRPEPLLCAPFPDLLRCDALVLTVVPLADVRRDGDFCVGAGGGGLLVRDLPGVGVVAAEIEELEGLLGTGPRGDVS